MRIGNKSWTNWNKAPLRLWQTQLNFAIFCASSACGVSSEHFNYKNILWLGLCIDFMSMIIHLRRILKRLQVLLPHEVSFNTADNPYTNEEFFKICKDYEVPHDPMRYMDEKFYWTY